MSEILFLAHRVPFPPDRGDKIRSHHILRHLATLAPVHVGTFGETDDDMAQDSALAALATSHCLVRRTKPVPLAAIEALATGAAVSLTAFHSARLARWIAGTLASRPISAIFVFSGQMAQYLPARFGGRVVMDFVDVDSAKFEAYARRGSLPKRALFAREARMLGAFEASVAARTHCSLLSTGEEAALFAGLLAGRGIAAPVRALDNGIDAAGYDPSRFAPEPVLGGPGPHLVFTGQMDYPPNIEAVEWFARQVMPRVRERFAAARFHVVGRAPTSAVRALEGVHGTMVAGEVADVRPWLSGADLVVAPLTIARGVQNKVLEAMAMARPVLASPEAATGIGATDGADFAIAADVEAMADRAIALLADPAGAAAMGVAARRFVVERRGWESNLAPLGSLLGLEPVATTGARDAA